jgi:trimethylamine--corrinoid protein Co-methyltransferase
MIRPTLTLLDDALVQRVLDEAYQLLEDPGVRIHSDRALVLLDAAGAKVDKEKQVAHIPSDVVQRCLETVPRSFYLHNAAGEPVVHYGDDDVQFDLGSASIEILDHGSTRSRQPATADLIAATRLGDTLSPIDAVSTCMVCADVPEEIGDLYRLFLVLQNTRKPVITGAFAVETWSVMHEMLVAVVGSAEALREKPIAVFDVCPSPPLLWSDITCENLIDCAQNGVPAELVSMPLTGATGPVTLLGSIVQHAAENLSGITIHQLAGPGSPIVWGGSPAAFDMRTGTTPMGAIETMMIDSAYSQVGKSMGLPTHAYMGMSDAKIVDTQSGFESGIGTIMAALAGVNMVSGAGMMDFESCFSLEKLVIDAEIISMAKRLVAGIQPREDSLAVEVIREVGHAGDFLGHPHTRDWYREELLLPTSVVDRDFRREWEGKGELDAAERAHRRIDELLSGWEPRDLPDEVVSELERITLAAARGAGMDALPQR